MNKSFEKLEVKAIVLRWSFGQLVLFNDKAVTRQVKKKNIRPQIRSAERTNKAEYLIEALALSNLVSYFQNAHCRCIGFGSIDRSRDET